MSTWQAMNFDRTGSAQPIEGYILSVSTVFWFCGAETRELLEAVILLLYISHENQSCKADANCCEIEPMSINISIKTKVLGVS